MDDSKKLTDFINASICYGYGPNIAFGDIGMDCGGEDWKNIPMSIHIRPAGFLGGLALCARGKWNELQEGVDAIIEARPINVELQTNPPQGNPSGWYIYGTKWMVRKALNESRFIIDSTEASD